MKSERSAWIICLCFSISLLNAPEPSTAAQAGSLHVVLISVDGLMPQSYTAPEEHGLRIPTLRRMLEHGAYSKGLKPVMPTVTYPSHTSMVTGVDPGTHGIVTNGAWDPYGKTEGDWRWFTEEIKAPTIWDLAKKAGLKTAMVSWPVTLGAKADAVMPEFWRRDLHGSVEPDDIKLKRLLSTPGLLEAAEAEFPGLYARLMGPDDKKDEAVTEVAIHVLKTVKPDLFLLHLLQVDAIQHEFGPWSPQAKAAIENADAQIARLEAAVRKAGFSEQTVFVIVSDHGFAAISKAFKPGALLRQKGLVTLDSANRITDWKASVITSGGSAYLYLRDPRDEQTQKTLLEMFGTLAGAPDSGIAKVASHQDIVALGGDPDALLALNAAKGFNFVSGYAGDAAAPSLRLGTHGYFPDDPAMRPSLIVYGRGVGRGVIEDGRLIDIGPTILSWFGLKMQGTQGHALIRLAP